jgi:hypothetical protein
MRTQLSEVPEQYITRGRVFQLVSGGWWLNSHTPAIRADKPNHVSAK